MPDTPLRRRRRHAQLVEQGWPLAIALVGIAAIGVGAVLLLDGPAGTRLPIYRNVKLLPWPAWACWSAAGGLLALCWTDRWHKVRVAGLGVLVAWWACRWALLTLGAITVGPPRVGIVTYLLLLAGHALLLLVEVLPYLEERPLLPGRWVRAYRRLKTRVGGRA